MWALGLGVMAGDVVSVGVGRAVRVAGGPVAGVVRCAGKVGGVVLRRFVRGLLTVLLLLILLPPVLIVGACSAFKDWLDADLSERQKNGYF